jgi:TonB-linked SusC/RagA family outer membrane protein
MLKSIKMIKLIAINKCKNTSILQQNRLILGFVVFLFCFFTVIPGFAQQTKKITGSIIDSKGETIIGANIRLEGTTMGTISDVNGNFQLIVPLSTVRITVSSIGYITQNVSIGSKNQIIITLNEDNKMLDEIVVVGYGSQQKTTLTGAISSVNNKDINTTKNQNIQNMLTGKIPGVRIIQKTSEPGQFTNEFDIRGFGSPLIVVDGVPRDNVQKLDPNEIESISVLKDASAAVYGLRAANGVVLVTTKKGTKGKPKISYSMYYGQQNPTELLKPVGAVDRMTLVNEISMRSVSNPKLTYTDADFEAYKNGTLQSTDWYDEILKKSALQKQHTISISGGSEDVNYFANISNTSQDGLWKSNDLSYNRWNVRSNIDAKISNRLKFSLKLNGIRDNTDRPISDSYNIFKTLWRSVPTDKIYANNNSNYLAKQSSDIQNVVAMTNSDISGYYNSKNTILQSSADLSYDIPYISGLTAKGLFSYNTNIDDNTSYSKEYNEYTYDNASDVYTGVAKNSPTTLQRNYAVSQNILYQISLNYKKSFAVKHNVSALMLFEGAKSNSDNINASRQFTISLPYLFAGNTVNQIGTADANGVTDYTSNGFVGKFNYDYVGKYLVEFSFREDGSSKFPANSRWGFFPGGSLGWRISEEPFIKNKFNFIDNLKIRGSYGKMGDDGAASYQFVTGYDYPNTNGAKGDYPTGYVFGGTYTNSLGFRTIANPNITWYTSRTLDLGLDADLWKGKLGFTIDIFQRNRDGLLATRLVSLPGTFGATMPQENLNSDLTKGIELELRHQYTINKVTYRISGNVAITRTMNSYLERASSGNSYENWRNNMSNRYNDIWFGYSGNGQYTTYNQIATSKVFTTNSTLPGDYIYEDWNNDGVIDASDMHPIATTTNPSSDLTNKRNYPLMNFGLSLSANYKSFDLSLLFQGSAMSYISLGEQLSQPLVFNGNALSYFMDRWHPIDATADPYDPNNQWVSGYYAYGGLKANENSTFAIQNGSYVRLKTIEIGYSLPKSILKRTIINDIRIYMNGYNLLTFSNIKGVDPEHPNDSWGYIYPVNKTINFGANVTF